MKVKEIVKRKREDTHTHISLPSPVLLQMVWLMKTPIILSHAHTSSSLRRGLHMASASTSMACGRAKDRKERE